MVNPGEVHCEAHSMQNKSVAEATVLCSTNVCTKREMTMQHFEEAHTHTYTHTLQNNHLILETMVDVQYSDVLSIHIFMQL